MRYAFDEFTIDLGTRQLMRDGAELHLSPKAFDLLATLLAERPRAVAKAHLLETVWPRTFVTEGNLNVLVAEIRRTLDDDAHSPRFVRTVPRFGYAFIASTQTAQPLAPAAPSRASHWLIWGRRRIELPSGEVLVGRDPACAVLLDVPGVSRHHARLRVDSDAITLEDLGSKNGTSLDGRPVVGRVRLADRDRFRIGPVELTYRFWSGPESTATWVAPQPVRGGSKPSS